MTVPYEESAEVGKIAYEAFAAALGWKFRGAQLPSWSALPGGEQDAFRAGGHEAIQKGWVQAQPPPTGKHKRR